MSEKVELDQHQSDMIWVGFDTRIDLMWEDEMTDEDKISFADFVREVAADVRAGKIRY